MNCYSLTLQLTQALKCRLGACCSFTGLKVRVATDCLQEGFELRDHDLGDHRVNLLMI